MSNCGNLCTLLMMIVYKIFLKSLSEMSVTESGCDYGLYDVLYVETHMLSITDFLLTTLYIKYFSYNELFSLKPGN